MFSKSNSSSFSSSSSWLAAVQTLGSDALLTAGVTNGAAIAALAANGDGDGFETSSSANFRGVVVRVGRLSAGGTDFGVVSSCATFWKNKNILIDRCFTVRQYNAILPGRRIRVSDE